ncbi:MAG: SpoIIE family protein phosphatase [Leptospiraceae bacterium]|nr:SpoIIE family protein phosphatase [Leptospiraceae bacterium]
MTLELQKKEENDINPIRLKTFLEVLRDHGYNITDAIEKYLPQYGKEVRGASLNQWLSHLREPELISAICQDFGTWPLVEKTGRECLRSAIIYVMPHLPEKTNPGELAYRIPSLIAMFLTHISVRITEIIPSQEYQLILEPGLNKVVSAVDLLFIKGLIMALYSLFNIVSLSAEYICLPQRTGPLPEEAELQDLPRQEFGLLKLSFPMTSPISRHKELSTYDAFVQEVLRRAAELLQEKKELMTAVEYLNRANEELEKEIRANKKELRMARNIQKGFVPPRIPDWKGLQFWVKFFPLAEVSGDFYDYFAIGSNKIGLLVADVSGHGVPAALISAIAKLSFSNHRLDSPAEVFSKVNLDLLRYVKSEGYLTSFYMIITSDYEITYSIAAAPSPLLYRARSKKVEKLSGGGTLLGMFPDASETFVDQKTKLEPGDKLFIFTDGLIEAENVHEEPFGEARLIEIICKVGHEPLHVVANSIMDAYRNHILGAGSKDDVTLITVSLSERVSEFDHLVYEARRLWNEGNRHAACQKLREAIQIFPRHTNTLFLLGKYLALTGQYQEATEYLTSYTMLKPYNADAYTLLAYCAYHLGYLEKAVEELKRSLSLRTENPSALYNLVKVYLAMGKHDEAYHTFSALEFLRPQNPRVIALRKKYFS